MSALIVTLPMGCTTVPEWLYNEPLPTWQEYTWNDLDLGAVRAPFRSLTDADTSEDGARSVVSSTPLSPEERRASTSSERLRLEAMSTCPSADWGSTAEAWQWEPTDDELALGQLDLDGEGTTFGLLADFEGTSIIIRVRDAATGSSVAVIKTTSSNTRVDAEVFAYRLSRILGFPELVPASSFVNIDGGALRKMRELLAATTYRDPYKEANRRRVVNRIDQAIRNGESFVGAIKPWLRNFMFHAGLGQRETRGNQALTRYLRAGGPQPDSTPYQLRQHTRLYSPAGVHQGEGALDSLAVQFSNFMVMDALMGQIDRYAGANLHFISVDGQRELTGQSRGSDVYDLGGVRFLALDNGASLRTNHSPGLNDLMGNYHPDTRVERFEFETIQRMRGLATRLGLRQDCAGDDFLDERSAIHRYLGLGEDNALRFERYLTETLQYIDDLEREHGDDIYLPIPADQRPRMEQAHVQPSPRVLTLGAPAFSR